MSKKDNIVEFAKELYLQYDTEGKKVYSLRSISTEIQQKFDKKIHCSTVSNWAKKHDWDKINEKIKQQSIEKAKDEKFTSEEKIIEAESDKLAKDYKNAENLANVGFSIIAKAYKEKKEHPVISVKDALTAIKLGTDIKFRISGINEEQENITILPITGIQIKK